MELKSGADDRLYGGLVTIGFRGAKTDQLYKQASERKIWVYGGDPLRLSTHIHTRPRDLDAFFALADDVVGKRKV